MATTRITLALDLAAISPAGNVTRAFEPQPSIAATIAANTEVAPAPPEQLVRDALLRAQAALDAAQAALDRGELLAGERFGGKLFLCRSGRMLVLRPWQADDPSGLIENPSAACDDSPWALIDVMPLTAVPLPPALASALTAMDVALALTNDALVERLVARLRSGGTISGGPTTDQRWTLSFRGWEFRIEGTRPEYERTDDVIAEAEVRRMIATFRMFGLARQEQRAAAADRRRRRPELAASYPLVTKTSWSACPAFVAWHSKTSWPPSCMSAHRTLSGYSCK